MTTNVSDLDSFIFHRKGTVVSSYYKTTASQLSEYFRDVYSAELDLLIADVEQIKKESVDGDILVNERVDAYADRVKVASDNIFPILMDGYWSYKIDGVANSTFRYNYSSCVSGVDTVAPVIDSTDPEVCLDKHAKLFYQEVLARTDNKKDTEFYALTFDERQLLSRTEYIVISDRPINTEQYPNLDGDINWETKVVEGDILQIAETKRTSTGAVIVNDEHYGMYKVVSVYNEPAAGAEQPFSLVKLSHIGGPDVAFYAVHAYQIKVMKSLTETLGADFVQISGDTMTGALVIDAATDANSRTLYNKGETHSRTLTLGEVDLGTKITLLGGDTMASVNILSEGLNVTTLDSEDDQVRITNDGVKTYNPILYSNTFNLDKAEHVTYKGYVDDADVLLDQKIAQVNERIDTISDVIEKQRFVMTFATGCWTTDNVVDMEAWLACMTAALTSYEDLSNKKTIYPKPVNALNDNGTIEDLNVQQVNALLVSSETLDDTGVALSVDIGDTIELQLVIDDNSPAGTEPQILRYIAAALPVEVDDGNELASRDVVINSETMYLISLSGQNSILGANNYYEGSIYVFKHFPKNQGIKVEDADARYLKKVGDDFKEGLLDIRNSPGETDKDSLTFSNTEGFTPLKIKATGQAIFAGANALFNPGDGVTSTEYVKVGYNTIDFGSRIKLTLNETDKLEISGTNTDFKLNRLMGVTSPAYDDVDTTAITIGFFKDHFDKPLVAGVGITLVPDTENRTITINATGGSNTSLATLDDVSVASSLTGGETLIYDAAASKWVLADVSTLLQGVSVMGSSEHETRVGGVWTDGSNFFLRVE